MPSNLAPVYLDDARVQLQGDPRPAVAKIVAASGKPAPSDSRIVRVSAPGVTEGDTLQLEDVIERAEQGAPVYLRVVPGGETGEAEVGFSQDESTGVGNRPAIPNETFGAGRTGIAGQGATSSPGDLPADKQAKSDFQRRGERPQRSREGAGSRPSSNVGPDAASDAD